MYNQKNRLSEHLETNISVENDINEKRIFVLHDVPAKAQSSIFYVISREFRYYDNFALNYALNLAGKNNLPLKVLFKIPVFDFKPKELFFQKNFSMIKKDFLKNNVEVVQFNKEDEIQAYLESSDVSRLIIDFNPIEKSYYKNLKCRVEEVDGHNIIPARYISDKQEYSAATFRRKVYFYINDFLTEYADPAPKTPNPITDFIEQRLDDYDEFRNNPVKQMTSRLSAYLNFGFVSAQRAALSVLKTEASKENKEAFLEELIVRKELSDNFCLYCKDFKSLSCIPLWAKNTLAVHKIDFRPHLYTLEELENGKTADDLWNAAQLQLRTEGRIESYLRMYWAKQLLYWTPNAENALETAIYLNDKYSFDAPSANGYTGILWSIGGLHDRAFMERSVIGKIRPMTYNGAKSKFKINIYVQRYLK